MFIPNCSICSQPLTENEFDGESGSFSTDHMRCYSENATGEWASISRWYGKVTIRRFTHREAARRQTAYLRQSNRHVPEGWFTTERAGDVEYAS